MLSELIDLARTLEEEAVLPPVGFSSFREPLRWVVYIYPGPPLSVYLEKPEINCVRPYSAKRTSGIIPYPVVDEAAYALGVEKDRGGGRDLRAQDKHKTFLELLKGMLNSPLLKAPSLREALFALNEVLHRQLLKNDPRFKEVINKDWVAFIYEGGGLEGQLLFEHEEIKSFWKYHLAKEVAVDKKSGLISEGTCSVCGQAADLIRTVPTKVKKLSGGDRQVMSLNKSAFVSFVFNPDDAHLGICLTCGEHISQALNYLLMPEGQHRKTLMWAHKAGGKVDYDSSANHVAVFWLQEPQTYEMANQEIDIQSLAFAPLESGPEVEATLDLLDKFLNLPWSPKEYALGIPDNRFFLAVLSPNGKGRVAIREWISASLKDLKERLKAYLQALKVVSPYSQDFRLFTIPEIVVALKNAQDRKTSILDLSPNLVRGLLRTAYLGAPPPPGLLEAAVKRLRTPRGREFSSVNKQPAPFQVLAAVLKLALTYGKKEAESMEHLNPDYPDSAYLCGRLLAVLEEAQRRAAAGKLNTTLVDRFYGAAATGPAAAFAPLLKLAQTAHFPKIRREQRGYHKLNETMTEIMARLDAAGGFPPTLNLMAQARFALGFYHQRAALAIPPKTEQE